MAKKKAPQGTRAVQALQREGVPHTLHPYDHGTAEGHSYGTEAAGALGVPPERIFKTLLAELDGDRLVVGIVPVSGSLDLRALASALGSKRARLAEPDAAARATGYVIGGISPIGQKRTLPTVLDHSALGFDTIYVSAGRRGLQVELAPSGLVEITGATVAPIARISVT